MNYFYLSGMISFILNDQLIQTEQPSGMALIDFIRYESGLKATKIGCREGDCGACIVLEGKIQQEEITYHTITSCLYPLGNAHGKHLVTLEGIKIEGLSPVQQALVEHNGTQCGFCTPGFVMSLTCFLLSKNGVSQSDILESIEGNICRCTGYKSIESATKELTDFKTNYTGNDPINWLVVNNYLPEYFISVPERLKRISLESPESKFANQIIAGGTDLMVQQPDDLFENGPKIIYNSKANKGIEENSGYITIGAEATATQLIESPVLQKDFPKLKTHFKLIASSPIRNMGTLAGNIVNASPIGDLSIFFMALNADLFIVNKNGDHRKILLKDFFLDYKKKDLKEGEIIDSIGFKLLNGSGFFNFEKVSKRQFLDIASVNSAINISLKDDKIVKVYLSSGGISPVPLFLEHTCQYLTGKVLSTTTLFEANRILQQEISPISDIRGSANYKRLLMRQLFYAHFIELFPEKISFHELITEAK